MMSSTFARGAASSETNSLDTSIEIIERWKVRGRKAVALSRETKRINARWLTPVVTRGISRCADISFYWPCTDREILRKRGSGRVTSGNHSENRSDRVAAATSGCRMRLSPTRNVRTPNAPSLTMSAWLDIPLSPTIMRSFGTEAANFSVVSRLTSKVRRSRLLMPMSFVPSGTALCISCMSWISIRTSIPLIIGDAGHNDENAVGAPGAGLIDLIGLE